MLTYSFIVAKSLKAATELCDKIYRLTDDYWTPFGGHKISLGATLCKVADWLEIAASGQRTAMSDEESREWFILECTMLGIHRQIASI